MTTNLSKLELAEKRRNQFRQLIATNETYPLATITYHGPSPEIANKIVVGIIKSKDQPPVIRTWSGEDIAEDVNTAKEISTLIKDHDVARLLTSEWVLSCPHEEGADYPDGETCPLCPDWS